MIYIYSFFCDVIYVTKKNFFFRLNMDLSNFEQFFYREPTVESITTGGHFQLLDITDEEKKGAEEFIHVSLI